MQVEHKEYPEHQHDAAEVNDILARRLGNLQPGRFDVLELLQLDIHRRPVGSEQGDGVDRIIEIACIGVADPGAHIDTLLAQQFHIKIAQYALNDLDIGRQRLATFLFRDVLLSLRHDRVDAIVDEAFDQPGH